MRRRRVALGRAGRRGIRRATAVVVAIGVLAAAAACLLRPSREEVRASDEDGAIGRESVVPGAPTRPPLLAAQRGSRRVASDMQGRPGAMPQATAPEHRPPGLFAYGIVVDEGGVPAPNVDVVTAWMDENGNPGVVLADRTTTDPTGHYVLSCPRKRPFQRRTVRARGAGRASATYEVVPCRFQRIVVRPTVTVNGWVVDAASGRGLAGASVVEWAGNGRSGSGVRAGWSSATASGPDGRFRLVVPREGFRASAWQEGYQPRIESLPPDAEGEVSLTLRLEPAPTTMLRRRLVQDGRPVAGVLVRLLNVSFGAERDPVAAVRTDGDGRFDLEVARYRDYAIDARVGALRAFEVVRGGSEELQDVELLRPVGLTGAVVRGGEPVAGVRVEVHRDAPREVLTARTDDRGRYRFDDVRRPRNEVRVYVGAEGPTGSTRWASVDVGRRALEDLVAPTIDWPSVRVRGHVRDERGRPVAGVVVGEPSEDDVATTDREGAYEILRTAGRCRIEAAAPGFVTDAVVVPSVEEGAAFDFVLRRGGRLEGGVRDEHGKPLDATVRVVGDDRVPPKATGPDGSWAFDGLVGASFRVRVEAAGYAPVERGDLRPDGAVVDVVLRGA